MSIPKIKNEDIVLDFPISKTVCPHLYNYSYGLGKAFS